MLWKSQCGYLISRMTLPLEFRFSRWCTGPRVSLFLRYEAAGLRAALVLGAVGDAVCWATALRGWLFSLTHGRRPQAGPVEDYSAAAGTGRAEV